MVTTANHIDLAQFAVGLLTGLVILTALLHVRVFTQAALCAAALAIGYVLFTDGVPGLVAYAAAGVNHLERYHAFAQGLLIGKFAAGLVKWRTRQRQGRWSS